MDEHINQTKPDRTNRPALKTVLRKATVGPVIRSFRIFNDMFLNTYVIQYWMGKCLERRVERNVKESGSGSFRGRLQKLLPQTETKQNVRQISREDFLRNNRR
jgi:hypothetical protein